MPCHIPDSPVANPLGTTSAEKQYRTPVHAQNAGYVPAKGAFALAAPEIHLNIMAHLDPVSQMCLGLTCQALHRTFHTIYGEEGGRWNAVRRPFGLAMRASACGEYVLNWWWDDWFLREEMDIVWFRSLGELLWGERIWGELKVCDECLKYKPKEAWEGFDYERMMRKIWRGSRELLERVEKHDGDCRRCRAAANIVYFEGMEAVRERVDDYEGKILGFERLGERSRAAGCKILCQKMTKEEEPAVVHHYERWEDVMKRLGI